MASLPYVTSPGNIAKALEGIRAAQVPDLVTQDFVKTVLKIKGGSGNQITSFLKKIGFASSDGRPSELYRKFRNPTTSGEAIAASIRRAYAPLYVRNEYMHELPDNELLGLIVEETEAAHDANTVRMAFSSLKALLGVADFSSAGAPADEKDDLLDLGHDFKQPSGAQGRVPPEVASKSIGLNVGYTINLNLPASSDPAVFNAIFKSLKEHLLRDDDV
ncbi:DUF5343 domain-containing protein [Pseudooceanicola algae]|uniref:DUF5343 domain-containing protein n=1 Tax=Pseudooceanicola algae TaxID=1537215 RepID=A0A418SFS6_9RHOB|nr:DUF5343 domain-containing protein [Pseudooceanicola algae]QPM90796.1 hypothetical protein PSAL_020360 [Pseudooceanicola algae]